MHPLSLPFLPFPTSLPLPGLPGNTSKPTTCIQSISRRLLSGNSPQDTFTGKNGGNYHVVKIIFCLLCSLVFESVIVCVKHANRETLLSKQKLVLLVASYVSLLNSSFLLLWRHTRTSAWPCTHHTISPLLLFLNTFLC